MSAMRKRSAKPASGAVSRLRAENEALQARLYSLQAAYQVIQGEDEDYAALKHRMREAVRESIPLEDVVLVVSRGDADLLDLYSRTSWHFPRQTDGRYSGFYPKRAISAIAHLEAMRARGASYLLIPATSLWWLDHYNGLRSHLERYELVFDDRETCLIYAIGERAVRTDSMSMLEQALEDLAPSLGDDPIVLDWATGLALEAKLARATVFAPPANGSSLPYLDESVDLVAVSTDQDDVLREAYRVARKLVVNLADLGRSEGEWLNWKSPPDKAAVASVSIVIPCHDGLQYTAACLATLRETLPNWFRGEIVVVDDASTDETRTYLKRLRRQDRRVRTFRNRSSKGFLQSCNRGAEAAKGDYLLFLNNDTVLLPRWLPPLLSTFAAHSEAGAVGGKLLFEDGRLQEAGGLVYSDASASKVGYFDPDAEAPIYQHLREVDYVSGAFMMTPRSLFHELGGFDPRYGFGYFDDDDYCFAVRAAGSRVYYQPESVIVHVEGASAGTDVRTGLKQLQVTNQELFAEKWRGVLERHPARPEPLDGRAVARATRERRQYAGERR
jgi:GT2 family glycosyltransferase